MLTSPDATSRTRRIRAVAALAVAAFLIGTIVGAAHDSSTQELADRFASAWKRGDYPAMHELLTPAAQARTDDRAFAEVYREAAVTATTIGAPAIGSSRTSGDVVVLPVTFETRLFGRVAGRVVLTIAGDGDRARIDWHPWMAFPGVRPGEQLQRTTEMPRRAAILARDGTPLATGPARTSPLGDVARAVVGDTGAPPADRIAALRRAGVPDDAQVGLDGLERIFDVELRGRPGGRLLAGTRVIAEQAPDRGGDVRTTISIPVQRAAVAALAGRLGGVVALRPATGEILAFAGIPFSGLQPPGSTFKIVTLAAALQHGVASPSSTYPYATSATIDGVTVSNANGESCGGTLTQAFAESCNSVFVPLGASVGASRLVATAEAFGFNARPELPTAATSTIPEAAALGDDLAVGSSAIGQGRVQATTLQMTRVAATIALGGKLAGLTLDADRPAAPGRQVIPPGVARQVRSMMVGVVADGTGRAAAIEETQVAGKTGTAELRTTVPCVADPATGRGAQESCPDDERENDPTDTDAWFAAFAPADAPRIAVGVLLVQSGAGGETAAPAARGVLLAGLKLPVPPATQR